MLRGNNLKIIQCIANPTQWPMLPVKTLISLCIHPVWSETSLSTLEKPGNLGYPGVNECLYSCTRWFSRNSLQRCLYSKTYVKRPLKNRQNKCLNDNWLLNEGRKYCRMLPLEHSAILLTCSKRQSVLKTIFWSFWEWQFYVGFTVYPLQDTYYFMHLSLAYIVELLKPNYIVNFHIICGQKHYILFFPLSCIIFTNISFSSIYSLAFRMIGTYFHGS